MKIKKKFNIASLVVLISMIGITTLSSVVKADGKSDPIQSIKANLINPVFNVNLTNGIIIDTNGEKSEREAINNSILDGTKINGKRYSLYDRFGGDIKFVPYLGESKIQTTLTDKIYTYFEKNNINFSIDAKEAVNLIRKPSVTTNNIMYVGRPDVLMTKDVTQDNKQDPRVSAWSISNPAGINAGIGNSALTVSEFITYLAAYVSGSGMYQTMESIWNSAWNSTMGKMFKTITETIFPFLGVLFVIGIIVKTLKYGKGHVSGRMIFSYILTGVLTSWVILSFSANPNVFLKTSTKIVTSADELFDKALSSTGSAVVKSDSTKNVRMAALWEKTVFNQWSQGMFQKPYSQLYSYQEPGKKDSERLQMSNDNFLTGIGEDGNYKGIKYNTVSTVGDPKVILGKDANGKEITVSNWASLAWSTQSMYHISTFSNKELQQEKGNGLDGRGNVKGAWPVAPTAPMNTNIYLDDFRWIDAKLNISNGYTGKFDPKNKVENYPKGNSYKETFISQGFKSIFLSLLLLPIIWQGFRKMKQSVLVLTAGIVFVWDCIKWFIHPSNEYGMGSNFMRFVGKTGNYLWISLICYMQITMYILLVSDGKNPLAILAWILISIYVMRIKPPRSRAQVTNYLKGVKDKAVNSKTYKYAKDTYKENRTVNRLAKREVKDSHRNNNQSVSRKQTKEQIKDLKRKYYENKGGTNDSDSK